MERLDTSGSNFPPQPDKVQILHHPGMGNDQIPVSCRGGGGGRGGRMLRLRINRCITGDIDLLNEGLVDSETGLDVVQLKPTLLTHANYFSLFHGCNNF